MLTAASRVRALDGGLGGTLDSGLGSPITTPARHLRPVSARPMPMASDTPQMPELGQPAADTTGGAMGMTQLPDGAGGAVAIPPISVAAPGLTPSIPATAPTLPTTSAVPAAPAAVDTAPMPWEAGTFDADHNAINSVIEPGANDPSRIDLAKQYYDQFSTLADADYGHNLTDATNAAASHGQIGSGMLTNRYGDLFSDLQLRKDAARNNLITGATEGTIADNRSNRAEQRTERGYQSDLAQQAILRRIQQAQNEFSNAATLYGLGNQNNPTNAYLDAAGQASSEASGGYQSIQQLLAALMSRRGAAAS